MELSVPRTGTVVVGTSNDYYYDPAFGVGGGIATITNSGGYTFTMSYTKSGNMTTDPAIEVMGDASGNLVGSQTVAGVGNIPSSALLQTGYLDISVWQAGFANNNLAIDNVQSYLGFPNPATAPVITSGLVASGQVGAAFNYQITATNSPTQFQATLMPVAAYSLVASAINRKGVWVARITITIN